jgi:hypothetical protein
MTEIINLTATLSLIQVWVYEVMPMFRQTPLNRKPFTCSSCLSFWVGLTLAIVFLNPIYLTLYLFTQIYERYV